jgi:hypothetical protein
MENYHEMNLGSFGVWVWFWGFGWTFGKGIYLTGSEYGHEAPAHRAFLIGVLGQGFGGNDKNGFDVTMCTMT